MKTTGKLYSIGYGNRQSEDFFQLLKENKIDVLVDSRSYPYSRYRPAYNKNRLTSSLPTVGIDYEFKGEELGGLSDISEALHQQGVDFLIERLKMGQRVVIMCCELNYKECHRYKIAEEISRQGYTVIHIGKSGELIPHEGLLL